MPVYDFKCPTCGQVYEVTRPESRAAEPLLCMLDQAVCDRIEMGAEAPSSGMVDGIVARYHAGHTEDDWSADHSHPQVIGEWTEVLPILQQSVGPWMQRLRGVGIRGPDVFSACIGPAIEIYSGYASVLDDQGRRIPLGGDPNASEPYERGYMPYVWEALGRAALNRVLGAGDDGAEADADAFPAIEPDAKLTVLVLMWQADAADNGHTEPQEAGVSWDVLRFATEPLGIDLEDWVGRVIERDGDVVRLIPVSERALQLLGPGGDGAPAMRPDATTLDRVHTAMLLGAGGRDEALRALLAVEHARGPDFRQLVNALSGLYPRQSEERRTLRSLLLALPD